VDDASVYEQLVDSLWRPDGPAPEAKIRPVHTIGTGASGTFTASHVASNFCAARHFQKTKDGTPVTSPVTIRFSNGSGNATQHDGWSDLRGMATRFHLGKDDKGQEIAADLLAVTVPDFFTPTVETFLAFAKAAFPQPYLRESPWRKFTQLLKLQVPRRNPYDGETISPDPGALAFANTHDYAKLSVFQDASIGAPVSFARAPYHAIHTFIVTGEDGTRRWVRFSWEPTIGVLNKGPKDPVEDDYLRGELQRRLARGPARFSLMLTIGEAGDRFDDSSRAWSFHRRRVFMGTLSIDKVADDQWADNEHLSFNPCRVVDGIDLSDDPILRVRRGTYEVSRLRRGAPLCPFSKG
jgi:catalase